MRLETRTDLAGLTASALFSDDGVYRYELIWRWGDSPTLLAWMLNPSTADHMVLDNTIKGLRSRALARGLGGIHVINIFAVRATYPKDIKTHPSPVGPHNDEVIRRVLAEARDKGVPIICGWGNHGLHRGRQEEAVAIAADVGVDLHAYKVSAEGCPCHPLYLPHALEPRLWKAA